MGPRVLIVGAAKSGTTGLYNSVHASYPGPVGAHFEPGPREWETLPRKGPLLVKAIIFAHTSFANEDRFSHRILITRDPRDRLISHMLYWIWNSDDAWRVPEKYEPWLALVREKEKHPADVPVTQILAMMAPWWQLDLHQFLTAFHTRYLEAVMRVQRQDRHLFHLSYEDFVEGRLRDVSGFLGFPVERAAIPSRVLRTGAHGDWTRWFTREDVTDLAPYHEKFMREFGYFGDLGTPKSEEPLPAETASSYVIRVINDKRRSVGHPLLSPDVPTHHPDGRPC